MVSITKDGKVLYRAGKPECIPFPEIRFPWFWILHIGIVVVWIPTIMATRKMEAQRNDLWAKAMEYSPKWMKVLCAFLFAYAFFNFSFLSGCNF